MLASQFYFCVQIIEGLSLINPDFYLKENIPTALGLTYFLSVVEFSCEIITRFFFWKFGFFVNGKGKETITSFGPLELCQPIQYQ